MINLKGWINNNFAITLNGNGEIKYCISNEQCEPNEVVEIGNYTKFIVNNGTNYVCANANNSLGISETKCEKFNIDKETPILTSKTNNINVNQKESNNFLDFLNITYGLSGGNINCDINNTNILSVGTHSINCTATGNNGLSTTKTFAVTINKVYFDYEIKITWDNNTFALPSGILISLSNSIDETVFSYSTEDKTDNNTGEWIVYAENIPKYDDNNNEIEYYVKGEVHNVGNYKYTPIAISDNEIKIICQYNPPSPNTVTVIASFENVDTLPTSISVNLLKNGVVYKNATLNGANDWSYKWDNLLLNSVYNIEISNIDELEGYTFFIEKNGNDFLISISVDDEIIVPDEDIPL